MAVTDLLIEGLRLMAIGMSIVFTFLLLLVGVLRLMSLVAMRLAPEPLAAQVPAAGPAPAAGDDPALTAVIGAAIARYRRDHPRP
jgi:oxaloacetate decarboxylase (Na+ extruding) subunit gamma